MDNPTEIKETSVQATNTATAAEATALKSAVKPTATETAEAMISRGLTGKNTEKETPERPAENSEAGETLEKPETETPGKPTMSLEDRLAKLEKEYSSKTQRTEGEFARLEYIHEKCGEIPRELVMAFLPATTDKVALDRAHSTLIKALGLYVSSCAKRGVIRVTDVGGSAGGSPVGSLPSQGEKAETPASMIAAGLNETRR